MRLRANVRLVTHACMGFTLVELMLVMGLVGILLGTGLGLIAGLSPADRAIAGLVEEVVRLAQRSAVVHGSPARVLLDHKREEVSAQVMRTVGTWHFEDARLQGGADLQGIWEGTNDVPLTDAGFQGKALDLGATGGEGQLLISVREEAAFDWSEGFTIRCAVRVLGSNSAVLMRMGEGVIVAVSEGGAIGAEFKTQSTAEDGRVQAGPRVRVETDAGVMVAGEWRLVEVVYDRTALRIYVDGIERVRRPEVAPVWMVDPTIRISDARLPFPGSLDRLVIGVVEELAPQPLPGEAQFHKDCPKEIVFAPGGALDPLVHTTPQVIRWTRSNGKDETLTLGLQGTMQGALQGEVQ